MPVTWIVTPIIDFMIDRGYVAHNHPSTLKSGTRAVSENDIPGTYDTPDTGPAGPTMKLLIDSLKQARTHADAEVNQLGFLGAFFQDMPFPAYIKVIQVNGDHRMVRVNSAFERVMGVSASEYFARTDAEAISPLFSEYSLSTDMECIRTGLPVESNPIFFNPHTGQQQSWSGMKWPIYKDGRVVGVCGISTLVEAHDA